MDSGRMDALVRAAPDREGAEAVRGRLAGPRAAGAAGGMTGGAYVAFRGRLRDRGAPSPIPIPVPGPADAGCEPTAPAGACGRCTDRAGHAGSLRVQGWIRFGDYVITERRAAEPVRARKNERDSTACGCVSVIRTADDAKRTGRCAATRPDRLAIRAFFARIPGVAWAETSPGVGRTDAVRQGPKAWLRTSGDAPGPRNESIW